MGTGPIFRPFIISRPVEKTAAANTIFQPESQFYKGTIIRKTVMKKNLRELLKGKSFISIPLVLLSFALGYLFATILFNKYGLEIHRFMGYLMD